jgi:hypothetical protein
MNQPADPSQDAPKSASKALKPDDFKKALPGLPDTVPEHLRAIYGKWRAGQATNQDLINASYTAMLDLLDHYKKKPLPTPPDEIVRFRQAPRFEQDSMSATARAKLFDRHGAFISQERAIKNQNRSSHLQLLELMEWCKIGKMPDSVIQQVQQAIWTHREPNVAFGDPVDV